MLPYVKMHLFKPITAFMINSPEQAFAAYLNMEERLPRFPAVSQATAAQSIERITDLSDDVDVFFFDGYGVLNVGGTAIPGAQESIKALQQAGKAVYVVTNAATQDMDALVQKYHNFGFDIERQNIINSREVMMQDFYREVPEGTRVGVIVPELYRPVSNKYQELYPEDDAFWDADVFLFLSGQCWDGERQEKWLEKLREHPRPIWVGNADLIAPLEQGVSHEPGSYTLTLDDSLYSLVRCYGKPFAPIFEQALQQAEQSFGYTDRSRMVMVGDTLHTDILGGSSMGLKTVLATGFGFLRDLDVEQHIAASRITPSFVLSSI